MNRVSGNRGSNSGKSAMSGTRYSGTRRRLSKLRGSFTLHRGGSIGDASDGGVKVADAGTHHVRNGSIRSPPNFDALRQLFLRQRASSRASSRADSDASLASSVHDAATAEVTEHQRARVAGGRKAARKPRKYVTPKVPESPETYIMRQRDQARKEEAKRLEALTQVREHRTPLTAMAITLPKKLKELAAREREALRQAQHTASMYRAPSFGPVKPEKVKRRSSGNPIFLGEKEKRQLEELDQEAEIQSNEMATVDATPQEQEQEEEKNGIPGTDEGVVAQVWHAVAVAGVGNVVSHLWNKVRSPTTQVNVTNDSAEHSSDVTDQVESDVIVDQHQKPSIESYGELEETKVADEPHTDPLEDVAGFEREDSVEVVPETLGERSLSRMSAGSVKDMIAHYNRKDSGISPLEFLQTPIGGKKSVAQRSENAHRVSAFNSAYGVSSSNNDEDSSSEDESGSSDDEFSSSDDESSSSDDESSASDDESSASENDTSDDEGNATDDENIDGVKLNTNQSSSNLAAENTNSTVNRQSSVDLTIPVADLHVETTENEASDESESETSDESESETSESEPEDSGMSRWRKSVVQADLDIDLPELDKTVVRGKGEIVTGFEFANLADDESFSEYVDEPIETSIASNGVTDVESLKENDDTFSESEDSSDDEDSSSESETSDDDDSSSDSDVSSFGDPTEKHAQRVKYLPQDSVHLIAEPPINLDPSVIDSLSARADRPSGVDTFVASLNRHGSSLSSANDSNSSLDQNAELDENVVNNKEELALVFKVLSHTGSSLQDLNAEPDSP